MLRNIIFILNKFGTTFLFVVLELVCLYMIVSFNKSQQAIWANSSNIFAANIYERYDKMTSFINLRNENEKLALENARLRKELGINLSHFQGVDSIIADSFEYIPALIINNSVSKTNNYITLNKGSDNGIEEGMGVICEQGVVGIVSRVNHSYALVNSILNQQSRISALVNRTNTLGNIVWKSYHPNIVSLQSIPQYVPIIIGDTVVTSGYSTVFQKGQMIGIIEHIDEDPNTGFYEIDVRLHADMSSLKQVYVIKNPVYDEIDEFINQDVDE